MKHWTTANWWHHMYQRSRTRTYLIAMHLHFPESQAATASSSSRDATVQSAHIWKLQLECNIVSDQRSCNRFVLAGLAFPWFLCLHLQLYRTVPWFSFYSFRSLHHTPFKYIHTIYALVFSCTLICSSLYFFFLRSWVSAEPFRSSLFLLDRVRLISYVVQTARRSIQYTPPASTCVDFLRRKLKISARTCVHVCERI